MLTDRGSVPLNVTAKDTLEVLAGRTDGSRSRPPHELMTFYAAAADFHRPLVSRIADSGRRDGTILGVTGVI